MSLSPSLLLIEWGILGLFQGVRKSVWNKVRIRTSFFDHLVV